MSGALEKPLGKEGRRTGRKEGEGGREEGNKEGRGRERKGGKEKGIICKIYNINPLNLHNSVMGWLLLPHLRDEETEAQHLGNLVKVKLLVSGNTWIQN